MPKNQKATEIVTATLKSALLPDNAETPTLSEIVSKKDAKALGRTQFFTGLPCIRGHVAPRNVASGGCLRCVNENMRRMYQRNPEKYRQVTRESNQLGVERWGGFVTTDPQICKGCNTELPANSFSRSKYRKNGLVHRCKSCVSKGFSEWKETPGYTKRLNNYQTSKQKLKQENPKLAWATMTRNAITGRTSKRWVDTDVTKEWLYENAPERCPLLGIVLRYERTVMGFDSAAVDRIDNTIGYLKTNCWIISAKANRIKTDATLEEIELVARNFRAMMDKRVTDLV